MSNPDTFRLSLTSLTLPIRTGMNKAEALHCSGIKLSSISIARRIAISVLNDVGAKARRVCLENKQQQQLQLKQSAGKVWSMYYLLLFMHRTILRCK